MLASALQALDLAARGASRPLARVIREIHVALEHRSAAAALRLMDRAWRTLPGSAATLAPLYGRLLLLEDVAPDAALRVLARIDTPDADIAALTARAHFRLRRSEDGRRSLDAALRTYSVTPRGLLALEASAALQSPELRIPGWIGIGPSLEFVGELGELPGRSTLEVRIGDRVIEPPIRYSSADGRTHFSFPVPSSTGGELVASCRGEALLGSGRRLPLDFQLDGRTQSRGNRISGWARIGWRTQEPVLLRIEDERGSTTHISTRAAPLPGNRWPFDLDLRRGALKGGCISVHAQLPDGRWHPLPDSPLLLPRTIGRRRTTARRWDPGAQLLEAPVDVVIPVYRGLRESLACIESALSTAAPARVIVVDDATDEARLAAALDDLAAAGRITLLRNERNLGFVRSVNRALAASAGRDVVLLNSDTLVFGDWLRRLRAVAYGAPRVGTVTPFSNDGSIASYPNRFGGPLDADDAEKLDAIAASSNAGVSTQIPVGVGFCLYIRHDCLEDVGELDAAAFGVGYGEESDFCMRAAKRGWTHRLAADVFVYHAGGGSFGHRRAALLDRSQRLLNLRYPGYDGRITRFLKSDPLLPLRRTLDEHRLCAFEGRFVLLVTLALEGGVERFVAERKREIRAQGLHPLVLKPLRPGDTRRCELSTEALEVPNLQYMASGELALLTRLLSQLRIEHIEIQHFLDLDPTVIDTVCSLGVPYDVLIHDYAWICPRITLINGSGRYCGEPEISACNACVRANGTRLPKFRSVASLRARAAQWLGGARSVAAPSNDTASRIQRYFPHVHVEVRPHVDPTGSRALAHAPAPRRPHPNRERLRVALIGAIGGHKGYRILLACARDAARRKLPLEFVVIGYTENDRPLLRTGRVEVTGRYVDAEVEHLLAREQPDLVFLPSVWPETWCYALDHALAAGLPVVAFDIGAIAERLRQAGGGTLLPLELDACQVNDRLLETGTSGITEPYVQISHPVPDDPPKIVKTTETMPMTSSAEGSQRDEGLSASLQVLPLVPGLYLFSVKGAPAVAERNNGALQLPAMHVGLGPGVSAEHVEFVAGPHTQGAWLFAKGDVLVARVSGNGATLILTSVRAASGDVLSIEVERLESRAQAPAAPEVAERRPASPAPAAVREPEVPAPVAADDGSVPLRIKTHIRARGDMNFTDAVWAGRVAPGLWLESFSLQPLRHLSAADIEYKGLTGTGFETPWLSEDQNCGTKGMSVPLVGFAVRLKAGAETAQYDCEYSGYFQSGTVVGPLRNGAPCRSTVANDPLEGIQVRLVKRAGAVVAAPSRKSASTASPGSRSEGPKTAKPEPVASRTQGLRTASRA